MLRSLIALSVLLLTVPASAAPSPRVHKAGSSKTKAKSKTKFKTQGKTQGKTKNAVAKPRTRRVVADRVRKGTPPARKFKVRHAKAVVPTRALVASKLGRRAPRLKALRGPGKVTFHPCASSLPEQAPHTALASKPGLEGAVMHRAYQWPVGATIEVGFVDGSAEARKAVQTAANKWTEHANLQWKFHLGTAPASVDVLIRFNDAACTSALGPSSQYRAERGEPSMNLCHMDQRLGTDAFDRVVLHEFGHALGLYHEHQSPKVSYSWNKEAVYNYYAQHGWSRDYTDQWVFARIAPDLVDASDYDADSIMHYAFPAEFTTDGVAFGGKRALSPLDKEFIAKVYPGKAKKKPIRRRARKLAVRNETGRTLKVSAITQGRKGKRLRWSPGRALSDATAVSVAPGQERLMEGSGRHAKLIARAADGSTWSAFATKGVQIAPAGGYLDTSMQTYVVVLDGPPDPPPGASKDKLFDRANKSLADGEYSDARTQFRAFVDQFPTDSRVPWAHLNIVISLHAERLPEDAVDTAYAMIVDHPNADATPYAWFYGGVSAMNMGWCEGAKFYLDYATQSDSGLPSDWRTSAKEHLSAVTDDADRWCW